MNKKLFSLLAVAPLALFASDANVETDILERTVNFLIFISIIYYLIADKIKGFFTERTSTIQGELDKVQELLKASETKVAEAKLEVENAKKIAAELVESANADVNSIKQKVEESVEQEIAYLSKSFDEKTALEAKRVKREVVESVLNQLLSDDNIAVSQEDISKIILKKVA
jgi:F-type H+-transporting ATPase subunit b